MIRRTIESLDELTKTKTKMHPKTEIQEFKDWLTIATVDELEEELLTLEDTILSILSQIEQHELRIKTVPLTQEAEEWRLRVGHAERRVRYNIKAVERRILALKQEFNIKTRAENVRLASESSKLKFNRITSYEHAWVEAALKILDKATLARISIAAKESLESADRQLEKR